MRWDGGDAVYTRDSSIGAHPSYSIARGFTGAFPIQGQLTPGRYAVDLTIDTLAAGSYTFSVE